MDRGSWRVIVHEVAESQKRLSNTSTKFVFPRRAVFLLPLCQEDILSCPHSERQDKKPVPRFWEMTAQ